LGLAAKGKNSFRGRKPVEKVKKKQIPIKKMGSGPSAGYGLENHQKRERKNDKAKKHQRS